MGSSLQRNESFAQGSYPGCMAGIFQILDYHHWHVKRLLPHRKHGERRRGRRNQSPKATETRNHDQEFVVDADVEAEPLLVKQQDTKLVLEGQRSRKTRSRHSREVNHRSRFLSFSLHSWLQRINPVHHLELSEGCCDDIDTCDSVIKANQASKDVSDQKLGECVDILDLFEGNKEFFLKILQDPEACGNRFHGLKNSNIKVRLSKSRSFPVAKPRLVRTSTLKHKQNEVWFFIGGDKSVASTRSRNLELPAFQVNVDEAKQVKVSSRSPSKGLSSNNHGWNQVVVSRFRDFKRKIKQALKETKREKISHLPTVNFVESTEIMERLEVTIDQGGHDEIDDDDLRKRRIQRVRRASSQNESLDRYTQLLDDTFSRHAKFSHSRSLRISTSEEKITPHAQKACRRRLSLSDLDSLSSYFNVAPNEALHFGMSFKTLAHQNIEQDLPRLSVHLEENENEEEAVSQPNQESEAENCDSDSFSTSAEVVPVSEGLELDLRCLETQETKIDQVIESQDFLYVKQILEMSTFIGSENEALPLHSLDQPLSPTLFRQIESYEDEIKDHNHNQLLFDLVNETLGDMNERSYSYFPRPVSHRPMPKENRLLQDVWKRTSSCLSLRPELDKSLDDVVARDLAKRDGRWMRLEWEREMVALELEDLVFDELLDQVLCCLD